MFYPFIHKIDQFNASISITKYCDKHFHPNANCWNLGTQSELCVAVNFKHILNTVQYQRCINDLFKNTGPYHCITIQYNDQCHTISKQTNQYPSISMYWPMPFYFTVLTSIPFYFKILTIIILFQYIDHCLAF